MHVHPILAIQASLLSLLAVSCFGPTPCKTEKDCIGGQICRSGYCGEPFASDSSGIAETGISGTPTSGDSDTSVTTLCGNGERDPGEACDGADLGEQTCSSQGWDGGKLECTANCLFDNSNCTSDTTICGNGVKEPSEECDGNDLGGQTCISMGWDGGALTCAQNCALNQSQCTNDNPMPCGNGVKEAGEQCDGNDLGGQSCASQGWSGGTLTCLANCSLSASGCCNNECAGGEAKCQSSSTTVTCGDFDQDACLEFGAPKDCNNGQTCSDGTCGCKAGNEAQFEVLDYTYPNWGPVGCSGDGSLKLKASAQMISPTVLRVYARKSDNTSFGQQDLLRLYVGEPVTCPNPPNSVKGTKALIVGQVDQSMDLTVNPYDGSWLVGETKKFWIGKDESGLQAFRTTNLVSVRRNCIP